MAIKLQTQPRENELQANDRLLREVLARASELQGRREGAYSLEEMERIGAELGVKPEFVRRAYTEIQERVPWTQQLRQFLAERQHSLMAVWWSCGWAPPVMISVAHHGHFSGVPAVAFFGAWMVYLGGGLLLSPHGHPHRHHRIAAEK